MIGYIEGVVVNQDDRGITLLTSGGVGYRIFLTEQDRDEGPRHGAHASYFTHLAVRDDALDLYGFPTENDLVMFRALLTVSGVGPKSAAAILGSAGTEALVRAVRTQDPSYLMKIGGLGKKTAEKIVMELKEKLPLLPDLSDDGQGTALPVASAESEALDALEALGYAIRDVRSLVQDIAKEEDDAGEIIRRVLRQIGT